MCTKQVPYIRGFLYYEYNIVVCALLVGFTTKNKFKLKLKLKYKSINLNLSLSRPSSRPDRIFSKIKILNI